MCHLFDLLSPLLLSSGVSIASGERSLLHVLTLRESDVSERLPDSARFLDGRLNGRTSGVCTPFSLIPHLRASRTLRALGLLEGFLSYTHAFRETKQHALAFTF